MLTAHSNVLRIYVARFPASSPANFFIPFAPHPATRRPPFLRSSNGRKSGEAVSFRGRRPWKNPPFRRAFCKKANFSTQMLEARNHRGTTYRRDHLLTSSSPSPSPRPKFRLSLSLSSSAEYRTCPYTWSRTAGFRRIGSPAIRVMDSVSVCSIRACQYAHAFSGIRARAWPPRGPRNSIPFCRQDVRPPLISRRVARIREERTFLGRAIIRVSSRNWDEGDA